MNEKGAMYSGPSGMANLRQEAERRLRDKKITPVGGMAEVHDRALLHELQVQQIELEMQNEELLRVQTAAQEASDKYQDLFDFAPVGYFRLDSQGQILEVNLAGAALFGLDRITAIKHRFGQFVAMEHRAAFAEFCKRMSATAEKQTCEIELRRNEEPVYAVVEGISAQDGRANHSLRVIVTDLSKSKRAQEALSDSEVQYRRLFEAAKDGILILDAETGMILDVNPFLVELLGYSHEQFLGKRIWELGVFKDVAANQANFAELQRQEYIRYEDLPLVTADGRRVNVEFVSNVYQADHLKVIQCNIRDITDRKQAEETLRANEQFHRDVLNALSSHVAVLDQNGIIVAVNAAWERFARENGVEHSARTGVGADYLAVCRNVSGAQAEEAHAAMEGIQAVSRGERLSFSLEYPCHSPQVRRWFLMHATPLSHPNRGMIVSHVDITERKLAEEEHHRLWQELAHVARLSTMGEMVAGIAHEVSQPLHSITTFAKACSNLLARDEVRLDQLREWNQAITVAAERSGAIIKRLRAFLSKSESQFALTTVREVIEESLSFFAFETRDRRVTVHAQIDAADLLVRIERIQIQQLLVNLLQNACEALTERTEGERQVRVRAALAGNFVEVSVADNGPGLNGCDVSKIFDPFFSTKPNGMGMGLAISRTIVEAHGGQIWAVPIPAGGVTFHFTLPIAAEGSSDVP